LAFDIFQGIGVAAALGIRPLLPTLAVGALAAGNVEIHFKHTDFSFLQSAIFLLVIAVAVVVLAVVERRLRPEETSAGSTAKLRLSPLQIVLAIAALALGALIFAGSLARDHHPAWPGLIGGVICAAIGVLATAPLLRRVRARLSRSDQAAAAALPVLSDGAATILAVLSVVAPPVGVILLALMLWLLFSGRRREEQKYAGLRILR
jgi:hypothetical protein